MSTLLLLVSAVLLATASAGIDEILEPPNNSNLPNLQECGFETVQRIIGGAETRAGEFPWVAAIEYNETATQTSKGIKCVGSVLNKRYILTAGHCLYPPGHILVKVWLGVWKISTAETTDKDKVVKFDVEEKILHESSNNSDLHNDIGLLKLNADIQYSDYIRPICLPKEDLELPPYGTKLTVTGWGKTETADTSDIKLKVDVPVQENTKCGSSLGTTMADSQMCAGGELNEDSCTNDSGGPLMKTVTDPKTGKVHSYPHGIVSFGDQPCGKKDSPAVYTRISKFVNWILSKIDKN